MSRARAAALWRRGQHGWPAAYPLVQFPNAPLLLWLAAGVARRLVHGDAADVAQAIGIVGLTAWAWLELTTGVNAFRRLLGAAGLVSVAARLTGLL